MDSRHPEQVGEMQSNGSFSGGHAPVPCGAGQSSDAVASGASDVELTILMPCLNEARTISACVGQARAYLADAGVCGEVLVADNGSTDGSQALARAAGARVVFVPERGYGSAVLCGISAAQGRYVVMGDADQSYDFGQLTPFLSALREGCDLVMGNRFLGGIKPGAMPFLNRYLGNPVLSFVGRLLFSVPCGDFHCGLRGFSRASILGLGLRTTGMEFASEMVVKAALARLRIAEVPTTLSPDGRGRAPHLHPWSDGWRHLRFLLIYSPRWLYLYPGLILTFLGSLTCAVLLPGPVHLTPAVSLDVHTFLVGAAAIQMGVQSLVFAVLARRYATLHGLLPRSRHYGDILDGMTMERMLGLASVLVVLGCLGLAASFLAWSAAGFGALRFPFVLRAMILAVTSVVCGMEIAFSAFLLGVMETPRKGGVAP